MTECEEEIESLNSNLDTKNEFISALQRDNANKREETEYLVNQLQKSNNVVKWDLILKTYFSKTALFPYQDHGERNDVSESQTKQ